MTPCYGAFLWMHAGDEASGGGALAVAVVGERRSSCGGALAVGVVGERWSSCGGEVCA